jgi:hypothetical protein
MRRLILAAAIAGLFATSGSTAEVEVQEPPAPTYRSQGWNGPRYDPRARDSYRDRYDGPPIRRPPPIGFSCTTERRTCDLRRGQPLDSFCECVSPSGRLREGRVTR